MPALWTAAEIFSALGRAHMPTPEQAAVIEHPMEPLLVVAGAGAGKTETMANRVVWMVANGLITADEVLGLTFTRKAAAELDHRIRKHLTALRDSPLIRNLPPDDPRRAGLENIQPTVATYDSFMGNVLAEYGLLLPIEPTATIADPLDEWILADDLLRNWPMELSKQVRSTTVLEQMRGLFGNLNANLLTVDEVDTETAAAEQTLLEMEEQSIEEQRIAIEELRAVGEEDSTPKRVSVENYLAEQHYRRELLRLAAAHEKVLDDYNLVTFGQQTSACARLVTTHPEVVDDLRARYGAVFLDEYQDTNHAQRVVLATMFGQCFAGSDGTSPEREESDQNSGARRGRGRLVATTAVGDPMQCIYSWRGAAVANLPRFPHDFRYQRPGEDTIRPAHKLELTVSFRNPAEVLTLANAVADRALEGHILHLKAKQQQWGALAPSILSYCTRYDEMNKAAHTQGKAENVMAVSDEDSTNVDTQHQNERFVKPLTTLSGKAHTSIAPSDPKAPRIDVRWNRTQAEETEWLVETFAAEFAKVTPTRPLSAAILVSHNKHIEPLANALTARGIPVDVEPGPLHKIPEIQQILAMATLVVNPHDHAAALQVLTSPRWNLGIADLRELSKRAKQLSAEIAPQSTRETAPSVNEGTEAERARAKFDADVADLLAKRSETPASLGDALADLDVGIAADERAGGLANSDADPNNTGGVACTNNTAERLHPQYTPEAAARLRELSATLRALRQRVGTLGVADMIADIETAMGMRTEVLARTAPGDPLAVGAVHLDRLLDEAHKADTQGRTLADFVQLMKMSGEARTFYREAGEVKVRPNCVQILTVHKAKGLEWDMVAVPFAHSGSYRYPFSAPGVTASTWLNVADQLPSHMCGDAYASDNPQGRPILPLDDPDLTAAEFEKQYQDLRNRTLAFESLEVMRVFYVAITRSKRRLMVTGNFEAFARAATPKKKKSTKKTSSAKGAESTSSTGSGSRDGSSPASDGMQPSPYKWAVNRKPSFGFAVLAQKVAEECGVDLDEWLRTVGSGKSETDTANPGDADLDVHRGLWHLHLAAVPTWPASEDDLPTSSFAIWPFDHFDPTGERAMAAARHPGAPIAHRRQAVEDAAALVRQAEHLRTEGIQPPVESTGPGSNSANLAPAPLDTASATPSELAVLWAHETTALIQDARARAHGAPTQGLGVELSTTELIGAAKEPEEFLRRRLRPIPFKPNLYAKRGTAFHNWLEQRFGGAQALIDDDALAYLNRDGLVGEDDDDLALTDEQLRALKDSFLASKWAERTPRFVEQPFMVKLGPYFIRGRMDAVFHDGEDEARGWTIVDWKTGRKPQGAAMRDAAIQLAIYRMALIEQLRVHGIEEPEVAAVFHYVRDNHTYAPSTLPTAEELVRTLNRLNA